MFDFHKGLNQMIIFIKYSFKMEYVQPLFVPAQLFHKKKTGSMQAGLLLWLFFGGTFSPKS